MIRAAVICVLMLCLALSCAEVKKTHHFKPLPSAIPRLNITNDTTATALKMSVLDIKTDVAANIATTTFDIRFYNPNDKILEGEFEFPLADGQHITRYALDINGSLREGVVVEKAKARVAFETTIRQKIDPGLVEKTKGNNFRTRIYPLPAKGYRRIVIAIEQTLEQEDKDLLYQLPLYATDPIDSFHIKISVIKSSEKPQLDENGIAGLEFVKQKDTYIAEQRRYDYIADKTVAFVLPGSDEANDIVLTENHDGQTYFYVNSRIEPKHKDKKRPKNIGLLWDVSASGQKRDLVKEMDLLKQYLFQMKATTVSLVPFNIYTQAREDYTKGSIDKLLDRLKSIDYDGGTQLGAIDLAKYQFDEVLLFSDGLSTFGKQDMSLSNTPVIAITTSPSANYSYLKYIAQQTHGKFIDLGKLELKTAIREMDNRSLQVISIVYNKSEIDGLVTQTTPILNTGLSFAGKLTTASANIKLELGFGNEVITTKELTISKNEESDYDQVKRIWATMKVSQLDMEYEKNKEDITKLGKQFSIVTQNTSLIVLDRVEDYAQHEIVPPAELQKEYYALIKEKQASEKDKKETAFNEALDAMRSLKTWWNKNYVIRNPKPPQPVLPAVDTLLPVEADSVAIVRSTPPVIRADEEVRDSLTITPGIGSLDTTITYLAVSDSVSIQAMSLPPAHFSFSASNQLRLNDGATISNYSTTGNSVTVIETAVPFLRIGSDGDGQLEKFDEGWKGGTGLVGDLKAWKADEAYLKTLEKTAAAERWSQYLSLKKQYNDQPSFFVDVARFFIEKNEKQTGIQVLSNVCEMKLEDAELLRIVANQLIELNETELAILTFNEVMKIREEDPQSYRDLALAYNESAEYNKALELLYKLVTGTWDSRFGDVKAIALNEMNAIISAHGSVVNVSAIDKRLIYAMPVDVRIVIGWSADNSDIDLWVTDPRNEKCFYSHNETGMGGKISRDVTQGYGPEEFLLKRAWKGNYKVDVNLFGDQRQTLGGPIAIKADLFTDFGKPTQKRKTINLRVTTNSEVINLGSLKFGS